LVHYTETLEYFGDQWDDHWDPKLGVEKQSLHFEIGPGTGGGTFIWGEDMVRCPQWHKFCHALKLYHGFVKGIMLCDIST